MKKILRGITIILLIGLLAACNNDGADNDHEDPVTPVETEAAAKDDFIIEKTVYGRATPASTTPVTLPSAGEIDTLEVENGDQVEEEDLMATLQTPAGKQDIRAPKDGEVVQLKASKGDVVSDEDPLAVIADMDKLKLEFTVTSAVQALFSKGDKLNAVVNDNKFEAKVTAIGTMPDDTGLYPIDATVTNEDKHILPGMIATMIVLEKKLKDVVIIPTAAIVEENDETFVYVVTKEKAKKVNVEIKERQSETTAIKDGIKAKDQVVVNGQMTLNDGDQVNVVEGE